MITQRRRKRERGRCIRRLAMTSGAVLLIASLAMSQDLREILAGWMKEGAASVRTFAGMKTKHVELTLPEIDVFALQLGVYDNGEHALSEQQRLIQAGIPCVIWQRDKMRIVCAAAKSRESLHTEAAGNAEAFVISERLPQVRLRISGAEAEALEAEEMIRLPDALFEALESDGGRSLAELVEDTRRIAGTALEAHSTPPLYARLAQSLMDWCDLVKVRGTGESSRTYAGLMMCTICREWRLALLGFTGEGD